MRALPRGFVAGAGFAGVDILVDELPHVWPHIVSRKEFVGLVLPEVASEWGVVVCLQKSDFDGVLGWDIDKSMFED
jgi:hypothetical protein